MVSIKPCILVRKKRSGAGRGVKGRRREKMRGTQEEENGRRGREQEECKAM